MKTILWSMENRPESWFRAAVSIEEIGLKSGTEIKIICWTYFQGFLKDITVQNKKGEIFDLPDDKANWSFVSEGN